MIREISAGGVVLREIAGNWHAALIEPQKSETQNIAPPATKPQKKVSSPAVTNQGSAVLCLPKGLVDAGEKPEAAALREVFEETGIVAQVVTKILDSKYVYVRSWGDGQRVFKIVSFYLMRYVSGEIDDLAADMRKEVSRALWVPLDSAGKQLAYGGERKVLAQALEHLRAHGLADAPKSAKPGTVRRGKRL